MVEGKRPNILFFVAIVVIAAVAVFGGRWYMYVAYASDPFDEVGISLNMKMPEFIRAKGCEMLKERFEGKTLPPAGCSVNGAW
ncbi:MULTISPECIES: hypothetical protein [Rhizobium]|uniref:Uncharacterized protein n=1 Tax=Rhizobium metallidurans TaxID=1265931 RepID=A0A7W6CQC8_9HYPH|nr:hypothetical protein [Rhizobium sp. AN80A]MBB3963198.1 hypothetical protein [Rhizobium metallidurans]